MALEWNPYGLATILLTAPVILLGLILLIQQSNPRVSRVLGLLLMTEGFIGISGGGFLYMSSRADHAYGFQMVSQTTAALMVPLYLAFLATIPVPIASFARSKIGKIMATGYAVGTLIIILAWPRMLVDGLMTTWYSDYEANGTALRDSLNMVLLLVLGYGLAVAVSYYRRAGPASRPQARAYLAAFAWRDIMIVTWLTVSIVVGYGSYGWLDRGLLLGFPVTSLVFAALLAYGVLKSHLLDIDLRIKVTLSRTTLAAMFIAGFFVASEAAALFFGERSGNAYVGIAGAGILVFAIAPLQRIADRVANRAMPNVRDTAEYREKRRTQVYQAAVEGAMEDGVISDRERSVLARLQDVLALSAAEALAIERTVGKVSSNQPAAGS